MNHHTRFTLKTLLTACMMIASHAAADGLSVDKVYHPYVQPLERELEFRWLHYDTDTYKNNEVYRLGYGQSLSSKLFVEAYVIGDNSKGDSRINAYELEAKWQLTEQGEYAADWGFLLELEKETDRSVLEGVATLLIESEWGRTVGTMNLSLAFEAGGDIDSELETALSTQLRYRYSPALEPAVEFYISQDTLGIGPVLMGEQKFENRKKMHWELGIIAGLSDETPDATLRTLVEFEF